MSDNISQHFTLDSLPTDELRSLRQPQPFAPTHGNARFRLQTPGQRPEGQKRFPISVWTRTEKLTSIGSAVISHPRATSIFDTLQEDSDMEASLHDVPAAPSDCGGCDSRPRLPREVDLFTGEISWNEEDLRYRVAVSTSFGPEPTAPASLARHCWGRVGTTATTCPSSESEEDL